VAGSRKWWTLAAVSAGVFMLLLDVTIVNVALPDIERTFGASLSDLQWVISAYALALAAFLLTAGSLADLFGRRLLFASGIVIFTAGSLACGLATGSAFLTIARGAQGIGGAIMFATSLALLAQAFPGDDRGPALGLFGAITGSAVAIGPVLGGVLTSDLSWRWIFYVNVPIGAVALAITLLRVEESRNPNASRPDWAGFATFSSALGALVYGLIQSQHDGWSATTVAGPLAASGVLLAAFLVLERRSDEPMLDLGLLRVPTFDGGLLAGWAMAAALFGIVTYLVVYMQNGLGLSAVATGVRFLPLTVAIFVAAGLSGFLTAHVQRRILIAAGFVAIGGGLLLMRGLTPASDWRHLLPGMIVAGLGGGLVGTPLVSTAVGVVEPARAGMASGINATFRQVGIATGVAGLGTILASHVRGSDVGGLSRRPLAAHAHTPALVGGLNTILLIAALVAFAAAASSLVLVRERDFVTAAAEAERDVELPAAA
jgi:EmrB/QacA subfamily drug resistance transporter